MFIVGEEEFGFGEERESEVRHRIPGWLYRVLIFFVWFMLVFDGSVLLYVAS